MYDIVKLAFTSLINVHLLLLNTIGLEVKDNYGSTPLIRAAKNGHLSIVDLLLRARANIGMYLIIFFCISIHRPDIHSIYDLIGQK